MSGSAKTFIMLLSIILGMLISSFHDYSFLIKYFLMGMLFFAFLDTDFKKEIISIKHLYIIIYIVGISVVLFFLTKNINSDLALGLFIAAIAPTAIASIPVIGYLKGDIGFTTFSVLLTNITIALLLPFLLPIFVGINSSINLYEVVTPILSVIIIPLFCAFLLKYFFKKIKMFFKTFEIISFFFFVTNIFLAMSKAGYYLRTEFNSPIHILILMAVGIFILTVLNFSLGWMIGKPNFARETSNSIGQKNTMFAIWIALTFINPVVALAPMMYTIYHNIFISYQLYSTK